MGATYTTIFFLGATNTHAVQAVVAIERTVFYRERAAGMYSALPYAFAQVKYKCSVSEKARQKQFDNFIPNDFAKFWNLKGLTFR